MGSRRCGSTRAFDALTLVLLVLAPELEIFATLFERHAQLLGFARVGVLASAIGFTAITIEVFSRVGDFVANAVDRVATLLVVHVPDIALRIIVVASAITGTGVRRMHDAA
jgi:hypothetical protein